MARSCFSNHRFDGGTVYLLTGFVIPWGLGASAVHLVSCRHVLGHAYLISPGVWIAFSFLARAHVISPVVASLAFLSSASLGGGYVPGACPHSHHLINHLVRRGRSFLSSSCSASSHWCPFFSSVAAIVRRTENVASHQPLRLVLIELGKTARNTISRSSSSDALGLLVPRLALPSRGASRALFVIVMVARGEGRVLRTYSFLSRRGEAECPSLVLRRGGVLALILRLPSRSASRRFVSSLVSFSDALRAVGGACLLVSS